MKKVRVIRRDDHAGDQDAKHIKYAHTEENPPDGLSDVPSGTLSFRRSDGNEFHSLERESGLDDDREDAEESVQSNAFGLKSCTVERARVFPVLEASTLVIRSTTQIND